MGVYQGDPLSVIIFNTVMNNLVDSITQRYTHLGYSLNSVPRRSNLLQYTDDTSLIGDGPSSCQLLLSVTKSWLTWSGMHVNVPKFVAVAIKANTGKVYNPNLVLSGHTIPYLGDNTFRFLGTPVAIHSTSTESREHLVAKLRVMLEKIDVTPITQQQKLQGFRACMCPRLTWDLSITDLPISWLQNTLQPIATKYLTRWSGLARSADLNRLQVSFPSPTEDSIYPTLSQCTRRSMLLRLDPTCTLVTPWFEPLPPRRPSMRLTSNEPYSVHIKWW